MVLYCDLLGVVWIQQGGCLSRNTFDRYKAMIFRYFSSKCYLARQLKCIVRTLRIAFKSLYSVLAIIFSWQHPKTIVWTIVCNNRENSKSTVQTNSIIRQQYTRNKRSWKIQLKDQHLKSLGWIIPTDWLSPKSFGWTIPKNRSTTPIYRQSPKPFVWEKLHEWSIAGINCLSNNSN